MVKNPFRRKKKKKNPFEASLLIDNPDLKVAEIRLKDEPFAIAVGKTEQREKKVAVEVGLPTIGKGGYHSQKDMEWQVLYSPKVLQEGFMSEQKLRELMAGTVYLASGSGTVFYPTTKFIEADQKKLEEAEESWHYRDPNDPSTWSLDDWDTRGINQTEAEDKRKKKKSSKSI